MAKYRVGPERYYRDHVQHYEGSIVTIPDDERPSKTFVPLDDAAKAAMKKHWPDARWVEVREPKEEPKQAATMHETQHAPTSRKVPRPSDSEPV